ncbi:alpha-1,6-mannosyl-glycoprotein 2-beta-N-acetylglucosaminyltransferase-like [Neltuma alba]|uniref:alpha-1,6-mannosyl-glycoprotein 2-beta-N-acetylglucosaminyltransferase-like n=1 Tax=Neltuma alba TaxID=207710 RepID=UPI0010A32FCF|nr:alpha-1,6-mannosyl-glycoprotein 2-beta-N-acetylglucosaminyltransferase-like [Prosopis alba]XP_028786490.1 alpha-1,6-mannosyl-glycoprotein 2-beta-N-acetylglucosaminyltransferase-like [Prosopis alba]
MAPSKKPFSRDVALRRLLYVVFITLSGVILLQFVLGSNSRSTTETLPINEADDGKASVWKSRQLYNSHLPQQNDLSLELQKRNQLPPKNLDLYPTLANDHIIIVLYVHNRSQYLQIVVDSLSKVEGINETLLIVSHDGYFENMNRIIDGIRFCQVKQIYAPYSPHLFSNGFPGVSPSDCKDKDDASEKHCIGNPDQYGNHRSPKIVSLKHHWWWMMNTVWDGLKETRKHSGHILFIEEDHFIFPNAYRNLQMLISLKSEKCSDCYAANLAPSDVNSRGEGWESLIAERMGNVGYSFNRTVWRKIHMKAREFCFFDDYNWDITMWATVYPSFGSPVYTLRGPRTSAVHFGKCGLHQGQGENKVCIDSGMVNIQIEEQDKVPNIGSDWEVRVYKNQPGYNAGFKGWGGWGDNRDRHLCLNFAHMYHYIQA